MANPYQELKKEIELEQRSGVNNPYLDLKGKDVIGTKLESRQPTNFRRLTDAREDARVAQEEAKKANSIKTLALRTLAGTPKATFDLGKQIIEDPKESAKQAALGLANGLSFGATDWLQRRAFVKEAEKYGMDEEAARSIADSVLKPQDNELSAIRGGANFAGIVAPYALAEKIVYKGLAYAAPTFVAKHAKMAKFLADIGIFNAVGQVEESFKPKDERNRGLRAIIDTTAAGAFFLGGEIFRRIRHTQFQSPFKVSTAQPFNSKQVDSARNSVLNSQAFPIDDSIRAGDIARESVYAQPNSKVLTQGFAIGRIDDVAQKLNNFSPGLGETFRKGIDAANTTYDDIIKEGVKTLDDFVAANSAVGNAVGRAGTEKVATTVTIRAGEKEAVEKGAAQVAKDVVEGKADDVARAAVGTTDDAARAAAGTADDITVATNDLPALQDFIKGSGEIDYKVVSGGLGVDRNGVKILARHEFNPQTGKHIIYASDDATASTLAHELGHYFDKQLTQSTAGLSRLLPNFSNNREAIEDALGSYAVSRLGGNASAKQISTQVRAISDGLITESKVLSSLRQGGSAQTKISEQFADAVSEVLTNPEAAGQAPVLTGLLKHLNDIKQTNLFGKTVSDEIKGAKFATTAVAEESGKRVTKVTVAAPRAKLSEAQIPKELEGAATTIQKAETKIQKIISNFNDKEGGVSIVRSANASLSRQEKNVASVVQGIREGGDEKLAAGVGRYLNKRIDEARAQVKAYGDSLEAAAQGVKKEGKVAVIEKEVARKLDRTKTGKKPDTPDIEAKKITNDPETEKFFNENIVSKVTGKERIGKTNEDILTRSMASKLSEKDFDNILTERFGNLSEDIVKAKRMMNDRALDIVDKVAGRNVDDIPAGELADITAEMNQLVEMFEVMSGVRTELSNSFRSLGIKVAPGENDVLRQVVGEIQRVIGKEVDPFTITTKLAKLRESSIIDKYFTIWYPAILSGPKTTARNIVGTGGSLVTETLSQLFSKEGRQTFSQRMSAMVGAQKTAWENAKGVFRGDENIISKFHEAPMVRDEAFKGKWAVLNKVEYVGRFLDAQDAWFTTIAKEGEVAALRTGQYSYGLESKALAEKINDGVAQAFAQRVTYRNVFDNTAVGVLGRSMTTLKSSDNEFVKGFFTFIMPFVRTVANVTDRKLDYIPVVNFARTFGNKFSQQRARAVARNIDLNGSLLSDALERGMGRDEARKFAQVETERITQIIAERLKHQQMGKFYMGLSVSAGTVPLAMSGRITGAGPKDKNERDTLMQSGWRPNSLILPGGVVLPYNNLGPLAGVFSMAGNLHDAIAYGNADEEGVNKLFWAGIQNFMRGELDQSFVSGIGGIYDALYGFKDFDQLLSEMAANAIPVPAAWTQTTQIINPKTFEAKTFLEQMQRKLGITAGLEPKLNAFGEQYSADLIWGLTPSLLNTDDEVFNWMKENNVFVGKPQKSTKVYGRGDEVREMTPKEYTQYLEATGSTIYKELNNKIRSGYFRRFKTEEEKKKAVSKIVSDIREREKRKFKF